MGLAPGKNRYVRVGLVLARFGCWVGAVSGGGSKGGVARMHALNNVQPVIQSPLVLLIYSTVNSHAPDRR